MLNENEKRRNIGGWVEWNETEKENRKIKPSLTEGHNNAEPKDLKSLY